MIFLVIFVHVTCIIIVSISQSPPPYHPLSQIPIMHRVEPSKIMEKGWIYFYLYCWLWTTTKASFIQISEPVLSVSKAEKNEQRLSVDTTQFKKRFRRNPKPHIATTVVRPSRWWSDCVNKKGSIICKEYIRTYNNNSMLHALHVTGHVLWGTMLPNKPYNIFHRHHHHVYNIPHHILILYIHHHRHHPQLEKERQRNRLYFHWNISSSRSKSSKFIIYCQERNK